MLSNIYTINLISNSYAFERYKSTITVMNDIQSDMHPRHYPLKPKVLKVEYVKPQNFKYGTTIICDV